MARIRRGGGELTLKTLYPGEAGSAVRKRPLSLDEFKSENALTMKARGFLEVSTALKDGAFQVVHLMSADGRLTGGASLADRGAYLELDVDGRRHLVRRVTGGPFEAAGWLVDADLFSEANGSIRALRASEIRKGSDLVFRADSPVSLAVDATDKPAAVRIWSAGRIGRPDRLPVTAVAGREGRPAGRRLDLVERSSRAPGPEGILEYRPVLLTAGATVWEASLRSTASLISAIVFVFILGPAAAAAPQPAPEEALEGVSWTADFESGSVGAWSSYPPAQDTAYDPSIWVKAVEGRSGLCLVREIIPHTPDAHVFGVRKKPGSGLTGTAGSPFGITSRASPARRRSSSSWGSPTGPPRRWRSPFPLFKHGTRPQFRLRSISRARPSVLWKPSPSWRSVPRPSRKRCCVWLSTT